MSLMDAKKKSLLKENHMTIDEKLELVNKKLDKLIDRVSMELISPHLDIPAIQNLVVDARKLADEKLDLLLAKERGL